MQPDSLKRNTLSQEALSEVQALIQAQTLPEAYINAVRNYLAPIAWKVKQVFERTGQIKLGIQGSQGSGKSTAALFIAKLLYVEHGLNVAVCSIDDFYLTREQRQSLASEVHPLLATRGVPGTHDTTLIKQVFNQFSSKLTFSIPIFEKQHDDRAITEHWAAYPNSADVLILEGWCVGLDAQSDQQLIKPCNELEMYEDVDLIWRRFVNQKLNNEYKEIFTQLDLLVALQAPSFTCVYDWRQLQEDKLIISAASVNAKDLRTLDSNQLSRFISHFERLTVHGLKTMPSKADFILSLEADHSISKLSSKNEGHAL